MDPLQIVADLLNTARNAARPALLVDESMLAVISTQDLGPVLYYMLHDAGAWTQQTQAVHRALTEAAARAVLVEQIRCSHSRRVIDALHEAGACSLVFKGAGLAYRHYPEPWLRARVDTDLLIREEHLAIAERTFQQLGLVRAPRPRGARVTHQQTYEASVGGIVQRYDVHWKISDPMAFADAFTYDELEREAEALPQLGSAKTVGDVHALLIACAHRVAHHFDSESLLWVCDIDAIARSLSDAAWDRFTEIAVAKQLRDVCTRGLELARRRFRTPLPDAVIRRLSSGGHVEPSAAYLRGGLRRVDVLTSDLKALGWRNRIALLREHLFPEPSYILQRYGQRRAALLPALYIHRIVRGAVAWFRPLR